DRVGKARKMTPARVDEVGQGRVWDGGTARQVGLVDQYGGLDDALAWVAGQAKLGDGDWHAEFLGDETGTSDTLLRRMLVGDEAERARSSDLVGMFALQRNRAMSQLTADLGRLTGTKGMQAYCLECAPIVRSTPDREAQGWIAKLIALLT
ncbi:MAG: S49 family peptidase, partial [Tsuneonella troitsensis]